MYSTEYLAEMLKSAREGKGLSQRALSEQTGVPQAHISKIENNTVDLRVSNLVKLARVLELEVVLAPRKAVPAVQSIVRDSVESNLFARGRVRRTLRELRRLQRHIAALIKLHPEVAELAEFQRHVRDLQHFLIPRHDIETIRNAEDAVKSFRDNPESLDAVRASLFQLRNLRNTLAHGLSDRETRESVQPAYRLEEDDHV